MFIRHHLKAGLITSKHLGTELMPADTLTKALGAYSFTQHNKFIGITDKTTPEDNPTRDRICEYSIKSSAAPAMQCNEIQNEHQ